MEKKIGKPWCLSDPWSRMVKATGSVNIYGKDTGKSEFLTYMKTA